MVRVNGQTSRTFSVRTGHRQGDPVLTTLFDLVLEIVIRKSKIDKKWFLTEQNMGEENSKNLRGNTRRRPVVKTNKCRDQSHF